MNTVTNLDLQLADSACSLHPSNDNIRVSTADLRLEPSVTMNLLGRPNSTAAYSAVDALVSQIYQGNGRSRNPSKQYRDALGAALADFAYAIAFDPIKPCFRPMGNASFDGDIGYYAFKRFIDDIERGDYATITKGYAGNRDSAGFVTRIRATNRLADLFHRHGIDGSNAAKHFLRPKTYETAQPVRLKAGSVRNARWDKIPGKPMRVDMNNPKVAAYASVIRDINEHMAKQKFSMPGEVVFFRGFNLGDDPSHGYKKGGRMYCYGGGYQSLPKTEMGKNGTINRFHRKQIIIKDNRTIEDDISACHITMAHGMLNIALPNRADLYQHPSIPRDIVKNFVTMTLGSGKIPGRWSDEHRVELDPTDFKRLNREYPIRSISGQIVDHIPALQTVIEKGMDWADFQFMESEIMVHTVHSLIQNEGITTLPVHDSFIVPVDKREICRRYLIKTFEDKIGLKPLLK